MIYHAHDNDGMGYSLDDLDKEARYACADLKPHLDKFDVVVVTGLSGVLPGVGVSLKLKVPLVILRKDNDDSHQGGGRWVNKTALFPGCRALWLDDFTSSGDTRKRIVEAVKVEEAEVVAEYLTRDREFTPYLDGEPDWMRS